MKPGRFLSHRGMAVSRLKQMESRQMWDKSIFLYI